MSRLFLSAILVFSISLPLLAGDPKPDAVEKAAAIQQAMASSRSYLTQNMPHEAALVLESVLSNVDNNPAFLSLLRSAYVAELKQLQLNPGADRIRTAQINKMLQLISTPADAVAAKVKETVPAAKQDTPAASANDPPAIQKARAFFKQKQFATAAECFAKAAEQKTVLQPDELSAWSYCRLWVVAEKMKTPQCDAAAVEREVAAALQLDQSNGELQKFGQTLINAAKQRQQQSGLTSGTNPWRDPDKTSPAAVSPSAVVVNPAPPAPVAATAKWETLESASFRISFFGHRHLAETIIKAAEERRKVISGRWSAPLVDAWTPKCEIVLHPSAEAYAKATGRPAQETGHAVVKLSNGRAVNRKIVLRADDPEAAANALPRELTHVILADLFPDRAPPKWAEEGMAVLASSPEEIGRYSRTLPRCYQGRELMPVATLLDLKEFPSPERITGFYCESVSLVDYLVHLKGERNFTLFLRDIPRYGTASALKRSYNIDGPRALEQAWMRSALDLARGQTP